MDKGYEKEEFVSFKIKASVAKKFRKFSRNISRSQSMTLLLMLEFFEYNEISPIEKFGPTGRTLEKALKQRMNAIIAILKDIEKIQTKPMAGMLMALLEQPEPQKKPLMIEKKRLLAQERKNEP